ncbi:hypothetical protein [Microbulbifer sp. PSTR4-B]|uniref:hypothetical protein n=1 Tax=Microbulbifer sp. PSTR4-B TaxID=3243396 RepID=UPI0040390FA4
MRKSDSKNTVKFYKQNTIQAQAIGLATNCSPLLQALCDKSFNAMKSDYKNYSRKELLEALASIDRDRFPERYQKLVEELRKPERNTPKIKEQEEIAEKREDSEYKGIFILFVSSFFYLWSFLATYKQEFYLGRGKGRLITFEDNPELFVAMVVLCIFVATCLLYLGIKMLRNAKRT